MDSLKRPRKLKSFQHIFFAFPLALFTGAALSDYAYLKTYQIQWTNFSSWLIAGGLLMGGFALLIALVLFFIERKRRSTRTFLLFFLTGGIGWVLALLNAFVHSRDSYSSVVPTGIILSLIVLVLILYSSWVAYSDA